MPQRQPPELCMCEASKNISCGMTAARCYLSRPSEPVVPQPHLQASPPCRALRRARASRPAASMLSSSQVTDTGVLQHEDGSRRLACLQLAAERKLKSSSRW